MIFSTDYEEILQQISIIDPPGYSSSRNYINGAVSRLSPYISRGVISLPLVKEIILTKYSLKESEKFIQELAWREYWQRVWQNKGALILKDLKYAQEKVAHHEMMENVLLGNTGIHILDEQIEKLYSTGYLHNHVRMYLASVCCNIAQAHWYQPARWMYYHLLDGDIASNCLSWQWVAGSFSSKKYYCNQENINKYCFGNQQQSFLDKSYDDLSKLTVPATLKNIVKNDLTTVLPEKQLPVIDSNKPVLIYNGYNLDPLWRKDEDVNRILLLSASHYQQFPVSKKVIDFIIALSKNIPGIQVFTGELEELQFAGKTQFISKEHPAFNYLGTRENREWLFPELTEYFLSFSAYWKKASRFL